MKSISKLVMAVVVAAGLTISAQASTVYSLPVDTGKMSKMSHKMDKKTDKKMDKMKKKDKMAKDTTKM
jgi:uncharacterized membrane protein (DUF106 family)